VALVRLVDPVQTILEALPEVTQYLIVLLLSAEVVVDHGVQIIMVDQVDQAVVQALLEVQQEQVVQEQQVKDLMEVVLQLV
jgi:hypothetical protein